MTFARSPWRFFIRSPRHEPRESSQALDPEHHACSLDISSPPCFFFPWQSGFNRWRPPRTPPPRIRSGSRIKTHPARMPGKGGVPTDPTSVVRPDVAANEPTGVAKPDVAATDPALAVKPDVAATGPTSVARPDVAANERIPSRSTAEGLKNEGRISPSAAESRIRNRHAPVVGKDSAPVAQATRGLFHPWRDWFHP